MSIRAEPDERSGKRLDAHLACAQRQQKRSFVRTTFDHLAEEEGFEPSLPGLQVKRFSRPPHSTTLPSLHIQLGAPFANAGRCAPIKNPP